MRTLHVLGVLSVLGACHRSVDIVGLYTNEPDTTNQPVPVEARRGGELIVCAEPPAVWLVQDSALAALYRRTAAHPGQLLLAHLRGVTVDSGSIYYARRYLRVREIVELRGRIGGECPTVRDTVARVLSAGPRPGPR